MHSASAVGGGWKNSVVEQYEESCRPFCVIRVDVRECHSISVLLLLKFRLFMFVNPHRYSVIAGGAHNKAEKPRVSIGGGTDNLGNGFGATIGGGKLNTVTGLYSSIGGGDANVGAG